MRLAIVLALTLCFLASAMSQTCNRPGAISLALLDSSIFLDTSRAYNGGVCDGLLERSCCTATADDALTTTFEAIDLVVMRYQEDIVAMREVFDAEFEASVEPFANDPNLEEFGVVDDFRRFLTDYKNAINRYLERLPGAFSSCLNGINAVRAWGLCSLCDPNLADFSSINSNDQLVLRFHPDTCTDVAYACSGLYTNHVEYFRDLLCAFARYIRSLSSKFPCDPECQTLLSSLEQACNGDLEAFSPAPGSSDIEVCFGTLSAEVSDARVQACGNVFCAFLAANFESGDLSDAADGYAITALNSLPANVGAIIDTIVGGMTTKSNVNPAVFEVLSKVTKGALDSTNKLSRLMTMNQPVASKRDASSVTTETNANAPQAYDEGTTTPLYRDNTVGDATTVTVSLFAMALMVVVAALF